jgi:hypothetical protein
MCAVLYPLLLQPAVAAAAAARILCVCCCNFSHFSGIAMTLNNFNCWKCCLLIKPAVRWLAGWAGERVMDMCAPRCPECAVCAKAYYKHYRSQRSCAPVPSLSGKKFLAQERETFSLLAWCIIKDGVKASASVNKKFILRFRFDYK